MLNYFVLNGCVPQRLEQKRLEQRVVNSKNIVSPSRLTFTSVAGESLLYLDTDNATLTPGGYANVRMFNGGSSTTSNWAVTYHSGLECKSTMSLYKWIKKN